MKYILKQQLIVMKPSYKIFDSAKNELYKVTGSFVGRESFELAEENQSPVAHCKTDLNVMSALGSVFRYNFKKYHISVAGKEIFTLARSLNILMPTFTMTSAKDEISGGYGTTGSYQFTIDGQVVCDIEKKNLTVGGAEYHIEIDEAQDQQAFLLAAIALDRIFHT